MIEIMPIADFPGNFGWGYDGVNLFAPSRLYGAPRDARAFVDRAHGLGVAVILDVVYNHCGPDGNHLAKFSRDYTSQKYRTEWGDPFNFDGQNSAPVREFAITNARYWIDEFHFDGLRLDATQQILDQSSLHVVAEIAEAVRASAPGRSVFLVGENEAQVSRFARAREFGGHGLDALWNDDFHHAARVAATGRAEAYYSGYRGAPQEFVSAAKHGFLYQGQWYRWQNKRRGRPAFDLVARNFVQFLENHDQLANSVHGHRLHQLTDPGSLRALTALLLLLPSIPMLFQGQEFASSAPFLYFADHRPELAEKVEQGRHAFLQQFPTIAAAGAGVKLAAPSSSETFLRCKLDFTQRQTHACVYQLHIDLLRLRHECATLADPHAIDGAVLGTSAFVLRFFGRNGVDRLLLVNLGNDLGYDPAPEPLLAPPEDKMWRIEWSSEHPEYGGTSTAPLETTSNWIIPGHASVLMVPHEDDQLPRAKLRQED